MASQYDPSDHIQHLVVAPRSESILDQREITIQSYQTTVPFDFTALDEGLERGWLSPAISFGVFSRSISTNREYCTVVLGLQDDLPVRTYDYDARRPLWFSWQNVIVDTVSIRYFKDDEGFLRFTTAGGGRRITEDRLQDFNRSFLRIPKEAVSKRQFDLIKLRDLCFNRFLDHLYMVKFSDPSGEEYRSIDHAQFQSRQYIDPDAGRLQEVRGDTQVKIESFDSDISVRPKALAGSVQVRFFLRGLSGSLRLRFPKLTYKKQLATPEEQAHVFYDIVDVTVDSILDADYYAEHLHSLADLEVDQIMFPGMVDLSPFREVLLHAKPRKEFFENLDLADEWYKWQPHLQAIDELVQTTGIAEDVTALVHALAARDPLLTTTLLLKCQGDAKLHRLGCIVADALSTRLHSIPAEVRARAEEALLSWAVDREQDSWDVNPDTSEILVYNLRWQVSDLSLDVLPAVLWKLIGLIHARLTNANGEAAQLLRRYDWCMSIAKGLPPNHSKLTPPLRLVAEDKVPASIGDAAKVLKTRITDLEALDDQVLDQFGLPLWPCLIASREDGIVTIRNTGVGIARALRAAPFGTLFSNKEVLAPVDLFPDASIQLPVSGAPTELDVRFTKYGEEHRIRLPITVASPPPSSKACDNSQSDRFDWARQIELFRATRRVLGEADTSDKGTISRAVQAGDIESNGETGQKCRVKVDSFKAWITRTKGLANDEVLQIMDAVMSEIRCRKR